VSSDEEIVLRYLELSNTGQREEAEALEDPDIHFWMSGRLIMSGELKKSQHRKASASLFATFPKGYALHIKAVTACGGRVVVEAKGEGELADGTLYSPDYCMVFELADGLITSMREYIDTEYVSATFSVPVKAG
jgi:ketosteroid isomerase-like protein